MTANIIVTSDPRYNINRAVVETAAVNVLQANKVGGKVELEVNIVGDRKMHELNKTYRGLDETTNILTFALEDPNPQNLQHAPRGFIASPDKVLRLGSILISYPQAVDDAAEYNNSVDEEISFLVDHGTKHLLGIHHNPH